MNGWTPTIPEDEQRRNLIASCLAFLDVDPTNEYWRARLAEAEASTVAELTAAEYGEYIAEHADWLDNNRTQEEARF